MVPLNLHATVEGDSIPFRVTVPSISDVLESRSEEGHQKGDRLRVCTYYRGGQAHAVEGAPSQSQLELDTNPAML